MRWALAMVTVLSLSSVTSPASDNPSELSFKIYRGYAIVVRGSVGNLKNLNFLVDTGAVPSVLDRQIAKKLHLTGIPGYLSAFTGKLPTERVLVPSVRLGPKQASSLPMIVQDLRFAEEALGTRVDAMIGFDFFSQGPFTIDYENKRLVFGPLDPGLIAIPYEPHQDYALVKLNVQNRSLALLLDSGASNLVLFGNAARDLRDAVKKLGLQAWSNMAGEFRVERVQLANAYVGGIAWSTAEAFVLPDTAKPPAGLDGVLGLVSLKAHRVGIDPQRAVLAWDQAGQPNTITGAAEPVP